MAPSSRSQTRRDRNVRTYVRRELYAHTDGARAQLDSAQIAGGQLKSIDDLRNVEPVALADTAHAATYVIRPSRGELMRSGSAYMRLRTIWASTWGRWPAFVATIEPSYRPVHFFTTGGVAVGAAATDLVRLAGLGVDWLGRLGVTSHDSVALVGGAGAGVEAWELSGGTRRAGIPLVVVEDATEVAAHHVTVIAGTPTAILGALAEGDWPELRLVLVFGRSTDLADRRLSGLQASDRIAVRRAWAVPGARSVWFECRGGPANGWHTTHAAELIEVDDSGEALWTGLGWAGTVFLRLRTDVAVESVTDDACSDCGHKGTRLFIGAGQPALERWLRADPRVADVRLTDAGADVLPVRAGANARLVSDALRAFPELSVAIITRRGWTR